MACRSPLLRVLGISGTALVLLAARASGSSSAGAGTHECTVGGLDGACRPDASGADDSDSNEPSSLMQKSLRSRRSLSTELVREVETAQCKHGGYLKHSVCICSPGFTGDHCEGRQELEDTVEDAEEDVNYDSDVCNKSSFTVYPYEQAHLWGSAYFGWEPCNGQRQSPIAVRSRFSWRNRRGAKLDTGYGAAHAMPKMKNNGHSIEVAAHFGNVTVNNVPYSSIGFHFHHPAEHEINGRRPELEMHMVNMGPDGSTAAVVGIMFNIVEKDNECLKEVFEKPLPVAGCERHIHQIDFGKCFKHELDGDWWSYKGSLTTPDCAEIVEWNLMRRFASISRRQLRVFQTRYTMNARPVQKKFGRRPVLNRV